MLKNLEYNLGEVVAHRARHIGGEIANAIDPNSIGVISDIQILLHDGSIKYIVSFPDQVLACYPIEIMKIEFEEETKKVGF